MKLNLKCDDFNLSDEDISKLSSLNIGLRVSHIEYDLLASSHLLC